MILLKLFVLPDKLATQLLNEMETKGLLYYNRKEIIIEDITKL